MNEIEKDNLILAIQQMHRWRMSFFGLVILLAGIAIGASVMLFLGRHGPMTAPPGPEIAGERMIRDLRRHLRLSSDQADKIGPILQKHMQALHEIRMNVRPQIVEQLQLMNDEISALLSEQQESLWQRHFQRLQRDLREGAGPHRAGPHGGPPPHKGGGRPRPRRGL